MVRIVYLREIGGRLRQVKPVRRSCQGAGQRKWHSHSMSHTLCTGVRRGQLTLRFR